MEREEKKRRIQPSEGGSPSHQLSDDVLEMICLTAFKHLTDFADRVRLRAICSTWRSLHNTNTLPQVQSPQSIPHLFLPSDHPCFFSLRGNEVQPLDLPEVRGKYCSGSCLGYLILLEHNTPTITLFNPLTRTQFQLPPITSFPDVLDFDVSRIGKEYYYNLGHNLQIYNSVEAMQRVFILKLVLSPDSTPDNYTAVGIFRSPFNRLAFCKSGDNKWTLVQDSIEIDDIIHHKGQFYALTSKGLIEISNLDGPDPSLVLRNYVFEFEIRTPSKYLVEVSDELIIIVRRIEELKSVKRFETKSFQVYQLDESIQKWKRMTSIGDHAVFVGAYSAWASNSPQCRANCIYFTANFVRSICYKRRSDIDGGHDFGIYDMKQDLIEPFPPSCPVQSFPSPIWVVPYC